jgi:hypothetical protein
LKKHTGVAEGKCTAGSLSLGREEELGFLDVVVEPNGHVDVEVERRLCVGVDLEGGADGEDAY